MLRFSECPTECDTSPTHILKTDGDFISFLLHLFFFFLIAFDSLTLIFPQLIVNIFSSTVTEVPNPEKHMEGLFVCFKPLC